MKTQHNIIKFLIASLLLLGLMASASQANDAITRVELRSTVRLASTNDALTIADIATVIGPQQDSINTLLMGMDSKILSGKWSTIKVEQIRELLVDSPTINTGSIMLVGNSISITRRKAPAEVQPHKTNTVVQASNSQSILEHHIERWIYSRLKTTSESTRIQFTNRDRRLLNTPTTGKIVEITEIGRSSKMSLRIVIYKDERIVTDTTIRCDVQIQRSVRVAAEQIRRQSVINNEQSTVETRWISPVTAIADPEQSLDMVCKKTIDSGTILLQSMLETPILIERGEIVSATSLSGSVSVAMSVRARTAGRLGDLIELESRDHKKRFTARVAGVGRVVIINKDAKAP